MRKIFAITFILIVLICLNNFSQEAQINKEEILKNYDLGLEEFNKLNDLVAINYFSNAIEACRMLEKTQGLPSDLKIIYEKSLEYRARSNFNLGQNSKVEEDFIELLKINPNYTIDISKVSKSFADLFFNIKDSHMGVLTIKTQPEGCQVFVNDKLFDVTPLVGRELFEGSYKITVKSEGYFPYEEVVYISPSSPVQRNLILKQNSRNCIILTKPDDVEIYIDDIFAGKASLTASPVLLDKIKNSGISIDSETGVLEIKYLEIGEHRLKYRKDCYEPFEAKVTINLLEGENPPLIFETIELDKGVGELNIESEISGNLFINNEFSGQLPKKIEICSGTKEIRVDFGQKGEWIKKIEVKKGDVFKFKAKPIPSLLYLGISNPGKFLNVEKDFEKGLFSIFSGIENYNLKFINKDEAEGFLRDNGTSFDNLWEFLDKISERDYINFIGKLRTKYNFDLLVIGYLPGKEPQKNAKIGLFTSYQKEFDKKDINLYLNIREDEFWKKIDKPAEVFSRYTGFDLIDGLNPNGPVVLTIEKDSPADKAGIRIFDCIVSVDDKKVKDSKEFKNYISISEKEAVKISFEREGIQKTVDVRLSERPVFLSFNREDILYSKMLADLQWGARGNPELKDVYAVYSAICFIHFNNPGKAMEILKDLEAGKKYTINDGTINYLKGIALKRLGMNQEARNAFEVALKDKDAYFINSDEIKLEPLILYELEEIK
ncbi:MAG: PEGA domain-containing protein [Acidobacteriota bacterium]